MISRMKKATWFPLVALALCALGLWTVQGVALTLVRVQGPSMVPSYADGQILFVNRMAYGVQGPIIGQYFWRWKAPVLGEPVVVRRPDGLDSDGQPWVVKRVVGTPGMRLEVRGDLLAIGDSLVPLSEAQAYWLASCTRVPGDSVFVVGDNLTHSLDSRDWGFVPLADVVGRPLF